MSLHEERAKRRLRAPCDGSGHSFDGNETDRMCDAASAVFFASIHFQAEREGRPASIPLLLCPRGTAPCPCGFTREELVMAESFLRRLGFVYRRGVTDMPGIEI
jgi:hypothetical protein